LRQRRKGRFRRSPYFIFIFAPMPSGRRALGASMSLSTCSPYSPRPNPDQRLVADVATASWDYPGGYKWSPSPASSAARCRRPRADGGRRVGIDLKPWREHDGRWQRTCPPTCRILDHRHLSRPAGSRDPALVRSGDCQEWMPRSLRSTDATLLTGQSPPRTILADTGLT
jgi:hypothetical protein